MDTLIQLDKDILLYLNSFNSNIWDVFFTLFTSTTIWIPLYASIAYVLWKKMGFNAIWALLAIGLTITLCDQISSSIFKPLFERLRPSWEPDLEGLVNLVNNRRSGKFGFVSSHATNSFGLAFFATLLIRNKAFGIMIFTWAIINSYSRIYLGVHYPGDILGGLILGMFLGWIVFKLYSWLTIKFGGKNFQKTEKFDVKFALVIGIFSLVFIYLASKEFLKLM